MESAATRPVVVLDVLGTLVDQSGSLEQHVAVAAGVSGEAASAVVRGWLDHVSAQEREVVDRRRAFVPSHELDVEALHRLVDDGVLPRGALAELAGASTRLSPWPDTVTALDRLATDATLLGLSNASRRVLAGLSSATGMRWHQVLSAEDAGTYKPDLGIYELALESAPEGQGVPIMVAAHAWDLRAAAAAGMRTAYVPRPQGDPPTPDDAIDIVATSLADLYARLRRL